MRGDREEKISRRERRRRRRSQPNFDDPKHWRRRRRRRVLSHIRDIILGFGIVAIFGLVVANYYLERFQINSESMEPTLMVGETVWAVKTLDSPDRGELVAFQNPWGDQTLIKRVIALPGEMIESRDGQVWVNMSDLNERIWIDDPQETSSFELVVLGPDEYFVMGDNRMRSTDSRDFGPIKSSDIEFTLWQSR